MFVAHSFELLKHVITIVCERFNMHPSLKHIVDSGVFCFFVAEGDSAEERENLTDRLVSRVVVGRGSDDEQAKETD